MLERERGGGGGEAPKGEDGTGRGGAFSELVMIARWPLAYKIEEEQDDKRE